MPRRSRTARPLAGGLCPASVSLAALAGRIHLARRLLSRPARAPGAAARRGRDAGHASRRDCTAVDLSLHRRSVVASRGHGRTPDGICSGAARSSGYSPRTRATNHSHSPSVALRSSACRRPPSPISTIRRPRRAPPHRRRSIRDRLDRRAVLAGVRVRAARGVPPWLHVRFGYAAVVVGTLMTVGRMRSARHAVAGFSSGIALSIGALCLYSYHVTGSLLPSKVWELMRAAEPATQAIHPAAMRRLVGLWLDINWELVAHAPVYLLALAGMWPLWRRTAPDRDGDRAVARDSVGRGRPALSPVAMVPRHVRRARGNLHRQRPVVQQPLPPRPTGAGRADDRRLAESPGLPPSRHARLVEQSPRALLDVGHTCRPALARHARGTRAGRHPVVLGERDGDGSPRRRGGQFRDWRVERRAPSRPFPGRLLRRA
jgi:hypothetical protein